MKKIITILLAAFVVSSGVALAQHEHGSESHDGHMMMQQHHEEQGMPEDHKHQAAVLRGAASIVKTSHPDLAAQLEQIAEQHEQM